MIRLARRSALWIGLAFLACGCDNKDTECLGKVGRAIAARLATLTGGLDEKVKNAFKAVQSPKDEAGLDVRVQTRLRWDKATADAAIQVSVHGSAVELKGPVRDGDQHRRAVELAETTQGVEKVIDALEEPKPAE